MGILSRVLKEVLVRHRVFSPFRRGIRSRNQPRLYSLNFAYIVKHLECRYGERVNGNRVGLSKPKTNRRFELCFGSANFRDVNSSGIFLRHSGLTMALMTSLLCAVLPLRFPLQNLRARNRHYLRRKVSETLEGRFSFYRLGLWHGLNIFHAGRERKKLPAILSVLCGARCVRIYRSSGRKRLPPKALPFQQNKNIGATKHK